MKTNKVVHFEIPTEDLMASKEFYQNVFGWKFKDWDTNYVSIMTAESDDEGKSVEIGAINGGLQRKGERAVTPTIVVEVEDIEGTLKEIIEKGGVVMLEKEDMYNKGFYAQFNDPEGNRLGLFQPLK
jgi:predicted enzyme related to lactoylglutathione lyase